MVKLTGYFYGIDIIRFLAALSVVVFHLGYLNDVANFMAIWPLTWFGWIGVEIFFVISGFVIANSASGKSPMQFLKGRALRLYPAVWCCATITLIVLITVGNEPFVSLIPSYLRSLALVPKGAWIDDVYWTLAVEIAFYSLIFGLLCVGMFSYINRVSLALTAFSSVSLCIIASRQWQPVKLSWISELVDHSNVLLARHGCFFALGIWIWISTTRPLRVWERASVGVAFIVCIGEIGLRGLDFLPFQVGAKSWLLAPVMAWSVAVYCIFASSRQKNLASIPSWTAELIRTLGLMTYPLYLVHHIVGIAIERQLILIGLDKWLGLTFSILSTVVISWIVCKLCEPRIRNAIRGTKPHRPVLQN
jgi:exopolysaccharide production protein ExoZ